MHSVWSCCHCYVSLSPDFSRSKLCLLVSVELQVDQQSSVWLPAGCRGRSCCTSSGWHRNSGGSCGRGCSCSCHEHKAGQTERRPAGIYHVNPPKNATKRDFGESKSNCSVNLSRSHQPSLECDGIDVEVFDQAQVMVHMFQTAQHLEEERDESVYGCDDILFFVP